MTLEEQLKQHLIEQTKWLATSEWVSWDYSENVNPDALTDAWLDNETSYIYRVGVLTAIDRNKCDWVFVCIGSQRGKDSAAQIHGVLHFSDGENDDIGRVLKRAIERLEFIHPVFQQ